MGLSLQGGAGRGQDGAGGRAEASGEGGESGALGQRAGGRAPCFRGISDSGFQRQLFPTLGAEPAAPCVLARNSAWAAPRAVVEIEPRHAPAGASQLSAVHEEARSTASGGLRRFLLGKRVAASWCGEMHMGVVRRIDACTVQIFWEEEYSQSAVRFEDVLSLAEN